jgi:hypothetical protein
MDRNLALVRRRWRPAHALEQQGSADEEQRDDG